MRINQVACSVSEGPISFVAVDDEGRKLGHFAVDLVKKDEASDNLVGQAFKIESWASYAYGYVRNDERSREITPKAIVRKHSFPADDAQKQAVIIALFNAVKEYSTENGCGGHVLVMSAGRSLKSTLVRAGLAVPSDPREDLDSEWTIELYGCV